MGRTTTTGLLTAALLTSAAVLVGCNRTEPDGRTPPASTAGTTEAQPANDLTLSTAVQAKYYTDDALRADRIDVSTTDGVVTLRGSVASEAAKRRAADLARGVDGVRDVRNDLTVSAADTTSRPAATNQAGKAAEPAAATATTGKAEAESQPAWITTKIQAQYFVSPEIKPWNIDVTTTSGGVVTLEGLVEETADKTEAVRIARETEGVTRVDDRLRVKQGESAESKPAGSAAAAETGLTDTWLTSKIQAKYFLDDVVKLRNIEVSSSNAVVTLSGTVATEAERRRAIALARTTDGVQNVVERLAVDPKLIDDENTRPSGLRGVPALPRPDPWITMKIQSQYFLDGDVKGHKIDVTTRDGVVTLSGSVDSASQKQEAEQIAVETEGVKRVVNRLAVRTPGGV